MTPDGLFLQLGKEGQLYLQRKDFGYCIDGERGGWVRGMLYEINAHQDSFALTFALYGKSLLDVLGVHHVADTYTIRGTLVEISGMVQWGNV